MKFADKILFAIAQWSLTALHLRLTSQDSEARLISRNALTATAALRNAATVQKTHATGNPVASERGHFASHL